jgi:hypothetical protein
MRVVLLAFILLLTACVGTPAPTPATVESALASAGASGFAASKAGGTAPQSYTSHADFVIGDKGGQYFICDTKRNCDAIYAYFDALKALAGPYTYRSGGGLVVVQLNSELAPDAAAKIEAAIKGM